MSFNRYETSAWAATSRSEPKANAEGRGVRAGRARRGPARIPTVPPVRLARQAEGRGANAGTVTRTAPGSPRTATRPLGEQRSRQPRVQRVPAAVHHQMSLDGMADQCQVADDVENLVPDELVFEAQRIVSTPVSPSTIAFSSEPPSASPAAAASPLPSGSRTCAPARGPRRTALEVTHRLLLVPQQRVIEADRVADAELVGRVKRDVLVALPITTGRVIRIQRRGTPCERMPAS